MNIIDTRSNIAFSNHKKGIIKNIPLFNLKGIEYSASTQKYTDIIFQSIPSVEFFKEQENLVEKNIYCMGPSTKNFLSQKGLESICADVPGSKELIKLLSQNKNHRKYLVVKGEDGLNEVFNYLHKNGEDVQEVICYKRLKLDGYDDIKKDFSYADAIIFSSTYAVEIFFNEIYSNNIKAMLFGISSRIVDHITNLGYEAKLVDYFAEDFVESIKATI
jgi:uroporphyrinogen-III synthase